MSASAPVPVHLDVKGMSFTAIWSGSVVAAILGSLFSAPGVNAAEILLSCHGKWADVRTKVETPYVTNIAIAPDGAWISHEGLTRSSEKSDQMTWRYFGKPDPSAGTFDDYTFRYRSLDLDVFGRIRRDGKDELVSVRMLSCFPVANPFIGKK